jgi:hypothetical protein
MSWRKWFVRMLVFTVVGGCAGAVILYQRFTNPGAVRETVLAKLKTLFPGAVATVDSARLRILGGIVVSELRLARKDDPDSGEILHVPSAVLYHDKQKILEGELALRKVELLRPHVRAVRTRDGAWNLQGLSGKLQPHLPLPIVVIHQGTLLLEDRSEGGTGKTVELTDVDLRLINDPLSTVTIVGSANSPVAGKLHVSGQWERNTQEITLTLQAQRVSLAGIVVERLQKLCPVGTLEGLKLEGEADLKADVAYRPGTSQPLTYDVRLQVTKAKLQHPKLPLPLEDLEASLRSSNGDLRLEKLQARSGLTEIEARGSAVLPCVDQTFECHVEARHLELREPLFAALPEKIRYLYRAFRPTGLATWRADVARRDGAWVALASGEPPAVHLVSETMGVNFVKFPYPLERLAGTVDMNLVTKLVKVDVTGYTGPQPVLITGTWQERAEPVGATGGERISQSDAADVGPQTAGEPSGASRCFDCRFDIQANDVPLDDKLVGALLLPSFKKLAQSFNAKGKGDIKAHIRHEPDAGPHEYRNEFHVRFHDASVRWEQFPYPLENVNGYLDIYPRHWEFREGRGTHGGAEVMVQGGSVHRDAKDDASSPGLTLDIVGRNVPVDDDLHRALEPMKDLYKSWETFRPRGQFTFTAKIDHRTLAPEDVDVNLDVRGCTIEPVFFPYALDDVAGTFHYHKNKLEIRSASAKHQGTQLTLDKGTVDVHGSGGHYTDLNELTVRSLVVNDDLIQAFPKDLRQGAASIQMHDPLTLKTRLVVAQADSGSLADIFWDGQLWLKGAKFSTGLEWSQVTGTAAAVGRYNGRHLVGVNGNILLEEARLLGQPFRKVQAKLHVKEDAPEVLLLSLKAPLFDGDISGEARVDFVHPLRFELNLTGSQIDLAQFGRHNLGPSSQFQGGAMARLHLTGQGSGSDTLDGHGSIDVPNGRLYNLPLILDILKFVGLGWDRTTFKELHALYSIHGKRVSMRKLEILGTTLSLTGKGEFNWDGTDVALDFYPGWARLDQLLPQAVRPVPPALTKNLLTIEMRGKITANEKDRKFTLKPVPALIDPLIQVRSRVTGTPTPDNRDEPRMLPALSGGK